MIHWIEVLAIVSILFILYRRMSMRKAGEAVGRAKARAKIPNAQKPQPVFKPESPLSRDFSALDLKPTASFDEVKVAYRELAKVWHPDRFGEDLKLRERANIKLGEINAAYERLKTYFGK